MNSMIKDWSSHPTISVLKPVPTVCGNLIFKNNKNSVTFTCTLCGVTMIQLLFWSSIFLPNIGLLSNDFNMVTFTAYSVMLAEFLAGLSHVTFTSFPDSTSTWTPSGRLGSNSAIFKILSENELRWQTADTFYKDAAYFRWYVQLETCSIKQTCLSHTKAHISSAVTCTDDSAVQCVSPVHICVPWSRCTGCVWFHIRHAIYHKREANTQQTIVQHALNKHWPVQIEKMQKMQTTSMWFANMKKPA